MSSKYFVCLCMYNTEQWHKKTYKESKITAEKYSKNKTHTLWVYRKFTDGYYAIWVKMIDLQNHLHHQNLCHTAMKKTKSYCSTRKPTEEQVKKYKRKMSKWTNDDKSVYICEDIAYKIIRYTNLSVIEADESRKNLGFTNNQSIIKIFAKENMVRQYHILKLLFRVERKNLEKKN